MGGANGGGDGATARGIAEQPIDPETVFELLANEGSRELLTVLYDRGGTVPVEELAERVAAREREVTDAEAPTTRHVRTRLRQVILPTLAETGIVTYDPETAAVTLVGRGETLETYLACVPESGDRPTTADHDATDFETWQ